VASLLVPCGTGEGQTATVAERTPDVLVDRGHDATAVDADGAAFVEGRLGVVPPDDA
jgi:menaquinone-dependent protoporphyrinogen IX oxidase